MYNRIAYIRLIYTYICNRVNTCARTIRLLSINRRLYFARVYVLLQRQYVRSIPMRQTRIAYTCKDYFFRWMLSQDVNNNNNVGNYGAERTIYIEERREVSKETGLPPKSPTTQR